MSNPFSFLFPKKKETESYIPPPILPAAESVTSMTQATEAATVGYSKPKKSIAAAKKSPSLRIDLNIPGTGTGVNIPS